MTYCVAIALDEGLVFASDSRTNAGVDQVSTYSKMHSFEVEGERLFVLLTAGNLATSQAVINRLKRDLDDGAEESLATARHMSEAAEYLGRLNREEQEKHQEALTKAGFTPDASFILGGQIDDEEPAVFMIYPQGNFITTSPHTPFLQIGESKYGKPILDRILMPSTSLADAARCALVSMDSTMRSNVTVGPPIEMLVYRKDSFAQDHYLCLEADHPYLLELKRAWDEKIREAFCELPAFAWEAAQSGRRRGTQVSTKPHRKKRKPATKARG
ncbi:MAG: proteasome-type protease [Chromatiales bacterium]|jgi:putative proteasome-type protease|nr:proteasome-type protease [Chromatiales bacterium]MDX9767790.1 proteasome-type protease [Ectothiorhodospiraceae bacterium]